MRPGKILGLVLFGILAFFPLRGQGQDNPFYIENIAGDLYRFGDGQINGVFLVAKDGIILADPFNPEIAKWLKEEVKTRFNATAKIVFLTSKNPEH